MDNPDEQKGFKAGLQFLKTLPGIITAAATLIAAVTGLIVVMNQSDGPEPGLTPLIPSSAEGVTGQVTATAVLSVAPQPTPPVIVQTFQAVPESISEGASATLEWDVTGATVVTISPEIGNVAVSGRLSVAPSLTTLIP